MAAKKIRNKRPAEVVENLALPVQYIPVPPKINIPIPTHDLDKRMGVVDELKNLSYNEQRFVYGMVRYDNGLRAWRESGHYEIENKEPMNALLRRPDIQAAIVAIKRRVLWGLEVSTERTISELAAIGYADPGKALAFDPVLGPYLMQIPEQERRAIRSIKMKKYTKGQGENEKEICEMEISWWNKVDALDKLDKRQPMPHGNPAGFQKIKIEGKGDHKITIGNEEPNDMDAVFDLLPLETQTLILEKLEEKKKERESQTFNQVIESSATVVGESSIPFEETTNGKETNE